MKLSLLFAGVSATLLLLFTAAGGCKRQSEVFPESPVVLISIDTLRADRLPVYGYRGVQTPALNAFARDSVVYDNAIAPAPLTLPSHVSVMTGLLPFQHGVRDNLGFRLAKTHGTLASFLHSKGYRTGGAVSSIVLDRSTGIAEGFDFYEDGVEARSSGEAVGHVQRPGSETRRLLEGWIRGETRERPGTPFFAFLHIYEPHSPYEPPEPFASRYRDAYDGEIAAADSIVGEFLEFLKSERLYARSLVILFSDHGEGLGEHGEDEHGIFLYREAIRVPLFVKLPGRNAALGRVTQAVGLADLFPTVVSAVGGKVPTGLAGLPLWGPGSPKPPEERRIYSETLYPRFHFGWSDLASLNDERFHYIEAPRPELYDWRSDPQEKRNLAASLPPAFRSMRAALAAMSRPLQAPGASDPETVKKLASLGYIGATSAGVNEKDLPDPKEGIGTIRRLKEASRLASEGRYDRAIALLRDLVRESPRMLDVRETLARTLREAGRIEESFEALVEVDRLQPATPQILLGLADLSLQKGDTVRARSFARAASAAGSPNAPEVLATIALAERNLAEARRQARLALERNAQARTPWLLIARIEKQAGDLRAAIEALDRIAQLEQQGSQRPQEDHQFVRGDLLARLGREKEAEIAFRAEMRDFPKNPRGWTGLALLYASQGKEGEARRVLELLTVKNPTPESYFEVIRTYEVLGDRRAAGELRAKARRLFPGAREPRGAAG